jgi:membrane protein YdbS with pleckstrin-like domain
MSETLPIRREVSVEYIIVTLMAVFFLAVAIFGQWLLFATLSNVPGIRSIFSAVLWVGIFLCLGAVILIRSMRWRGESYTLTKDMLLICHDLGMFGVTEKAYPYESIAYVSVRQNVLNRRYNAGTIRIQFQAKSHSHDVHLTSIIDPTLVYKTLQKRIAVKPVAHVSITPQA